jgi:hypothetical protein
MARGAHAADHADRGHELDRARPGAAEDALKARELFGHRRHQEQIEVLADEARRERRQLDVEADRDREAEALPGDDPDHFPRLEQIAIRIGFDRQQAELVLGRHAAVRQEQMRPIAMPWPAGRVVALVDRHRAREQSQAVLLRQRRESRQHLLGLLGHPIELQRPGERLRRKPQPVLRDVFRQHQQIGALPCRLGHALVDQRDVVVEAGQRVADVERPKGYRDGIRHRSGRSGVSSRQSGAGRCLPSISAIS